MSGYVIPSEVYGKALMNLVPSLTWDAVASRSASRIIMSAKGASATAIFPVYSVPDGNTTALPETGSASTINTDTVIESTVTLQELGEGIETVPAKSTFLDPNNYPAVAVKKQMIAAGKTLNTLARTAGISTIPASGSYGSWSTDVISDEIVYLGTGSTSETARNLIDTSDTITVDMIDKAYEILESRGAEPVAKGDDGSKLYYAVCSRKVWNILKGLTGANDLLSQVKYTALGANIIRYNTMGTFGGFIWISDPDAKYAGAGASGIDVYPVTFFGADFLGKAFLETSSLPVATKEAEILNLYESIQLRILPANDSHGRQKNVVWYGFLGYGVVNPFNSFRLETSIGS